MNDYINKMWYIHQFSSVQSSHVRLLVTPRTAAHQVSLFITNSRSSLKPMSIESVMPSNHFILCHPLLLLPSIFPSIRVFSSESVLRIRWLKDWSFSFSISPSNEHSGLISFRMDWLDPAVQGTLKSILQHHSSKASILQCSAFFIVQLSHPYMTTGKTIALTRRTFVGKVTSLLFNMLSRLVITFLPRSKRLLISWLQSPPAVILEPKKIKSATVSTVSPSICHEVMGPDAMIIVFWIYISIQWTILIRKEVRYIPERNLEKLVLSERSQTQQATYVMIPFKGNVQNKQIHRDRKQISDCQEEREMKMLWN